MTPNDGLVLQVSLYLNRMGFDTSSIGQSVLLRHWSQSHAGGRTCAILFDLRLRCQFIKLLPLRILP
jgi:hypothetical protein